MTDSRVFFDGDLLDVTGAQVVGIQISPLGDKIWVCVDGQCRLRVSQVMGDIHIEDMRKSIGKIKRSHK